MARKKTTNEPRKPLELLVPAEEARAKLLERIEKGKAIRDTLMNSEQIYKDRKDEYSKWDSFNTELLKRLFSTSELSDEYRPRSYGVISLYNQSLAERVRGFQKGIDGKIHRIDSIIERIELIPLANSVESNSSLSSPAPKSLDTSKVFIVHGHDNEAKLEVARFIETLGFESIILHEQASGSKTIIEKIEAYSNVGFGVVIYTPCDVGAKSSNHDKLQGRARQNVVFEHGFLIGKLGRQNVCPLVKGKVETPNDISGIVYTSMDHSNWKLELAKELRTSGYPVDMNKVI